MQPKFTKWQYYRSFLFPIVVECDHSSLHPYIEVAYASGRLVLNTATTNYSYGSIERVYEKAYKAARIQEHHIHNVLILGYGAGTAATLLLKHLQDRHLRITGVEKDERIIYYAKTYFHADVIPGLNLVQADAQEFLKHDNNVYDLVIVDVALDMYVPEEFESEEFLRMVHQRLKPGGLMLFTKVTASRFLYKQYLALQQKANNVFHNAASVVALGMYRILISFK